MQLKIKKSIWALVFAYASLFTLGLADNIRGTLFPELLAQFQLTNTQGSWSFAATSSSAFIASLLSAQYLLRFTISSLLALAVMMLGLGLALMGFSSNYLALLFGSLVLGLGFGWMGVAQNLLVTENVEAKHRSQALSGLHGMYGLASFFAPLLAASAAQYFNQWQSSFFIVAGLCLLFVLVQYFIKPQPRFENHRTTNQHSEAPKKKISKLALSMVCAFFSFYVVAEILVATRLALYMRTYFAMDLKQSAQYVTLFFMFLLLGRLTFAFIRLPFSLKAQLNGSLILSLLFIALGLKWHPFFLVLSGLSMAPYYPLCVSHISEISQDLSRVFLSFAMSFQSLAVVSMHLGVGYMTDQFGLAFALGAGIVALGISLICLNFHPKKLAS